jgi:hypothetical protein
MTGIEETRNQNFSLRVPDFQAMYNLYMISKKRMVYNCFANVTVL